MLKLSKRVEYGLIALLHMDVIDKGEIATAKEISELFNLPPDLLGKVLQKLAKTGFVEAIHGAKGGYRLSQPLDSVHLGQVIEAVDGPVHLTMCQDDPGSCDQYCSCTIREPVIRIQEQLIQFMGEIKLSAFRRTVGIETHVPITGDPR